MLASEKKKVLQSASCLNTSKGKGEKYCSHPGRDTHGLVIFFVCESYLPNLINWPGVNFINLFTCGFFTWMTKKLKSHFTKHFCMKFGEVYAEKISATCEAAICRQLFKIHILPKFDEIDLSSLMIHPTVLLFGNLCLYCDLCGRFLMNLSLFSPLMSYIGPTL
jgi:hypothetical protein